MKQEIVSPSVNLLESMRSIGYSLEAAVADLVDNSIAAGAKNLIVDADVIDGRFIAILDDGAGMSPADARTALQLAGTFGDRAETDLGRFGLGLKTASLSQARSLTVVAKQGPTVTALRWDIDRVRESGAWTLLVLEDAEIRELPLWPRLQAQVSGTMVLWERLDLLIGDATDPGAFVAQQLTELRDSLALVFHRYLNRGRLTIEVNGIALKPTDPFLKSNPRTQSSPTETIKMGPSSVQVTAFTLPHPSNLTAEERRRRDLGDGMRDAQGFYVYRNQRLISQGHWYGLARISELSKQTRIQVDIPNALDHLWQLDIKKSRAEPPQSFKQHLRRLIDPILERGRRVHTFRARRIDGTDVSHVWAKRRDRDGFFYEVNLTNPLVEAVLSRLQPEQAESVVKLLQSMGTSYPVLDAYHELAGTGVLHPTSVDRADILDRLAEIKESNLLGSDVAFVTAALSTSEPFDTISDLREMVDSVWGALSDAAE